MSVNLNIPESITDNMRLPEAELEQRLLEELALALYAQGILSFGKAAELARVASAEFAITLGQRGIARHYSEVELEQDLRYAGRQ